VREPGSVVAKSQVGHSWFLSPVLCATMSHSCRPADATTLTDSSCESQHSIFEGSYRSILRACSGASYIEISQEIYKGDGLYSQFIAIRSVSLHMAAHVKLAVEGKVADWTSARRFVLARQMSILDVKKA
jgi:hypothetical protein